MKLILVLLFCIVSVNSYAYSVDVNYGAGAHSIYNKTFGVSFYDTNGNKLPQQVEDYTVGGPVYGSIGSHFPSSNGVGVDFSFADIVSQTDDVCSEITTDCGVQRFNQFVGPYNTESFGQTSVNDVTTFIGTAQQDLYLETSFTESGSASFQTDYPELFYGSVINPFLDSDPEGVFDFTWDETTTTNKVYIAKGEQFVFDLGYILYGYAETGFISNTELIGDFTQFYIGNETLVPVSTVPLPTSILFFGSGLISLFGFFKRKEKS
jgi:hypothetical protein